MIYMKKMTILRIDPRILEKAQNLGLNVSRVCGNALKLYMKAIEGLRLQFVNNQAVLVGPLGFEPRIASAPGWYPNPS